MGADVVWLGSGAAGFRSRNLKTLSWHSCYPLFDCRATISLTIHIAKDSPFHLSRAGLLQDGTLLSSTSVEAISVFVNLFLNIVKTKILRRWGFLSMKLTKLKTGWLCFWEVFPSVEIKSESFYIPVASKYYLFSLSQSPILSPEEKWKCNCQLQFFLDFCWGRSGRRCSKC